MSKHNLYVLWDKIYPCKNETIDYSGRRMTKSAIGNPKSRYCPTIDHVRPLSKGGDNSLENIIICNAQTNSEKGDSFPTWHANDKLFQAKRASGSSNKYFIHELD